MQDGQLYESLARFRLAVGHKSSMNLTGNRKSVHKGTSAEFSDFREYLPGDDIRRIDWNAYGRLDRFYIKEYMEEKEAVISILIDTSASMEYGARKKSERAVRLASAMAFLGLNNLDRVAVYDMQRMRTPFVMNGGRRAFPKLGGWLEQCPFTGRVDILEAVRQLPEKGQGVTILISDFLQEEFLTQDSGAAGKLLRFLEYRRQRACLLHVLAGEELEAGFTGTKNLIDMEDGSALRLTLDAASLRLYQETLQSFTENLKRECARTGAFYAICSTERDFQQLIFQDLRMLYDI